MTGHAIYLTDLERCQPQNALSPRPKRHRWQAVGYEAEGLKGTMLIVGEETAAPEITYPLNVQGWHRVYIGLLPDTREGATVLAKLTDDRCFSILMLGGTWDRPASTSIHRHSIHELYWKAADLTGRQIHLGQYASRVAPGDEPGSFRCLKGKIAYIKLIPLSDAEVNEIRADRARRETKRLYAHNDAHGYLYLKGVVTPEDIYSELEPYRHTDVARMYWEIGGGDILFHLGTKGRLPTCDDTDDFGRLGDRLHAEAWRAFRDRNMDPLQLALEYCHDMGIELHASYRTAGFFYPTGLHLEHWHYGGFYEQHPELRAVSRDGQRVARISYAFPETRRFIVALLREAAEKGVDGIALLYNRRPPFVEYEPPLVEGFIKEYGQDPRQLDERDPRWLQYRSIALTQFMRELRQELDAMATTQRRQRRITVSAVVMNWDENIYYGLDLKTWIAEGLLDTLIPYTSAPALDSMAEAWSTADMGQVEKFVELTRGTACELALNIMPRFYTPEGYRRKAAALYAKGVERFFFWDAAGPRGRANFSPSWETLARLGHKDEIETWLKAGAPDLTRPTVPLHWLGGYNLAYQTPG